MIGETLRRVRFAPILTATVLTVLLLLLVKTAANVLVLLFLGILISLYLRALAGVIERRLRVPDPFAYIAALSVTVAAVVILVWVLVPPVIEQTQQLLERTDRRVDCEHPGVADPLMCGQREQAVTGAEVENRVAGPQRRRLEHARRLGDARRVGLPMVEQPLGPAAHRWPK